MRCIFLAGTLLPPELLAGVPLPVDIETVVFDWMTTVTPCDLASCVRGLRDVLGDEPAVVVAHSSGAAIAAACAIDDPAALAGLVLINSGPNMKKHKSVHTMIERMSAAANRDMWVEFARANVADDCPQSIIDRIVAYSEGVGAEQACAILRTQEQTDLGRGGQVSGLPVEIVHGTGDRKRSAADAREWLDIFPAAHVELIDRASHTPYLEHPEIVGAAVARCLDPARLRSVESLETNSDTTRPPQLRGKRGDDE